MAQDLEPQSNLATLPRYCDGKFRKVFAGESVTYLYKVKTFAEDAINRFMYGCFLAALSQSQLSVFEPDSLRCLVFCDRGNLNPQL